MKTASSAHFLLEQIGRIQRMEPGKLCVMRRGPHGPYYNLQCREQGSTRSRYVPSDQYKLVAEHTANYQRFQALVEQYAAVVVAQTRAEREAGAKEKSQRRKSFRSGARKSNI
jgi:hypothetical protein